MQSNFFKHTGIASNRASIMLPSRSMSTTTYTRRRTEEQLTPRRMTKKMLSPYMYLIHENTTKGVGDTHTNRSTNLIVQKQRPQSCVNRVQRLPFEPHYNHERGNHMQTMARASSGRRMNYIENLDTMGYLDSQQQQKLKRPTRTKSKEKDQSNQSKEIPLNAILSGNDQSRYISPEKIAKNEIIVETEKKNSAKLNYPPRHFMSQQHEVNEDISSLSDQTLKGDLSIRDINPQPNKVTRVSQLSVLKAKYDKAMFELEERNKEIERYRIMCLGFVGKVKSLRERHFGDSEAALTEEVEIDYKVSFNKEIYALEVNIKRLLSDLLFSATQNHEDTNIEAQKNAVIKQRQMDEEKDKAILAGKLVEKEKIIGELHKALQASNIDVEMISKELNQQRLKNVEVDRNAGKQALESERSMLKAQGEIQSKETEFQRAKLGLENEIEHLKAEKKLILEQQSNLKESLEASKKKQLQAISIFEEETASLKLELSQQILQLKKENDDLEAQYKVLLKEYQRMKIENEHTKNYNILKQENVTLVTEIKTIRKEQADSEKVSQQRSILIESLEQKIAEISAENAILKEENSIAMQRIAKYKSEIHYMTMTNSERQQLNQQVPSQQQYSLQVSQFQVDHFPQQQLQQKSQISKYPAHQQQQQQQHLGSQVSTATASAVTVPTNHSNRLMSPETNKQNKREGNSAGRTGGKDDIKIELKRVVTSVASKTTSRPDSAPDSFAYVPKRTDALI